MALNMFGGGPGDVTTNSSGDVVGGVALKVYTAALGGQRVTELYDPTGEPLAGVVASETTGNDTGRITFQASDQYQLLFLDAGYGMRWAIPAREAFSAAYTAMGKSAEALTAAQEAQTTASGAEVTAGNADGKATKALDLITSGDFASSKNAQQAIAQLQTITPTTDELTETVHVSSMVSGSALTAKMIDNTQIPLWVAPFNATILSVGIVFESFSSPSPLSDTNYVNFYLLKRPLEGATSVVARAGTDLDLGTAVVAGRGWEWDHSYFWDVPSQNLAKGEVLAFKSKKYGSQPEVPLPLTITFRYRPL